MRIGYFGGRKWAYEPFEKIVADERFEIVFVVLVFSNPDLILRKMAEERNIPVLMHKDVNSQEFIDLIAKYEADIFVNMFHDQIYKPELFNFPKYKFINTHPGKLPFYRGLCSLNWALINDEKEFGVTTHYVDEGIDTGDIITQMVYPITDEDNYGTLLEKAYAGCTEAVMDALTKIYEGKVSRIKQKDIDAIGIYGGRREEGDEIIDWNQTSREIFNFVRALAVPGPRALSWISGNKIRINKVKMIPEASPYKGIPGQIVGITESGFIVKTGDTIVEVLEFECEKKPRMSERLKRN